MTIFNHQSLTKIIYSQNCYHFKIRTYIKHHYTHRLAINGLLSQYVADNIDFMLL